MTLRAASYRSNCNGLRKARRSKFVAKNHQLNSIVATSPAAKSAIRKAGLFYFVWVMFSYCTGGPFGLEDMVTTSGPGMTLIYLLIIPFFWSIPVSLVSAELTTAMPVEGGFYRWSRAAFGNFWDSSPAGGTGAPLFC